MGLGLNDFEPAELSPADPRRRRCGQLPAPADPFGGVRTRTRGGSDRRHQALSPVRYRRTPTGEHGIASAAGGFDDRCGRRDGGRRASRRSARQVRGERTGTRRAARLTADPLVRVSG